MTITRSKLIALTALAALLIGTVVFLAKTQKNRPAQTSPSANTETAPAPAAQIARETTPAARPTLPEEPADSSLDTNPLQQDLTTAQEQAAEETRQRIMQRLEDNLNQSGMNQIIAEQQRVLMLDQFSALAEKLNLSPEEAEYFFDLITERRMAQVEMGMKLMTGALTPEERSQLMEKVASQMALFNDEIDRFLNNAEDSEYFRYYEHTEQQRSAVRSMAAAAELGSDTEELLIKIMYDEANSAMSAFPKSQDGSLDPTQFSAQDIKDLEQLLIAKTPKVLQQGSSALSQEQLPLLESAYQQYITSLKNQLQMVQALFQSN